MFVPKPHFLLYSQAAQPAPHDWRFVLKTVDGTHKFEAADTEPEIQGERLELLAVVRGLEALDQPSHVTLVTASRYVSHGFEAGLDEWRLNDWQWEHYDELAPISNRDLWQRIDRAMRYHVVECRYERPSGVAAPGFLEPPFTTVTAAPLSEESLHTRNDNEMSYVTVQDEYTRIDRPERGKWKAVKLLTRRRLRQLASTVRRPWGRMRNRRNQKSN